MLDSDEGGNSFFQSKVDYTPPEHLDLFFTDMGIFTPSGISDELT
jgi:translation initiation factor 2B subunit (eIF-2B alpha/beta/delta family)